MSLPTDEDPGGGGGTGGGTGPSTPPSSGGSWRDVIAYDVVLNLPARVEVLAKLKQSFGAGGASWAAQLLINGTIVDDVWGQATIDNLVLMGSANLGPGTWKVSVRWAGASSITVYRPRLRPTWSFK